MASDIDHIGQLILYEAPSQDPGFDFAEVLKKRKEVQRPPMSAVWVFLILVKINQIHIMYADKEEELMRRRTISASS